jgi:hypothetical protein
MPTTNVVFGWAKAGAANATAAARTAARTSMLKSPQFCGHV